MAETKYKEILQVFCSKNRLPLPSYMFENEEGSFYCEVSQPVLFCTSFRTRHASCALRELTSLDVERQRTKRRHRRRLLRHSANT